MSKNLNQIRHGKDFHRYFATHPNLKEMRHGKGDHEIAKGPTGAVVYPVGHEIGKGLRVKIIKMALLAGLGILALLVAL